MRERPRSVIVADAFDDQQSIVVTIPFQILDLSHNRFRSLDSLRFFSELEELNLDGNDLDDNQTRFPKLARLQTLMINKNRLQDIYKLTEQLRLAYPSLSHLSLLGNDACPYRIIPVSQSSSTHADLTPFAQNRSDEEYQRYRHLLICRIPTLKFLDASEIHGDERRIATQLGDILFSIAELKQTATVDTDRDETQRKHSYTPLPSVTNESRSRSSISKLRHNYNGEGSQGNKFVQDRDL
jgi:leucine-rich melanocyte differentiation-associated protein